MTDQERLSKQDPRYAAKAGRPSDRQSQPEQQHTHEQCKRQTNISSEDLCKVDHQPYRDQENTRHCEHTRAKDELSRQVKS